MYDEIKEIYLSNLEWTKTHNNMGGVIGNIVFKDNMSYEEYQKLFKSGYFILCDKDYIINLQQENERLKENAIHNDKVVDNARWNEMIYKSRIDKAKEYIMSNLITEWNIKYGGKVSGSDLPADAITPILDIIDGGDEE